MNPFVQIKSSIKIQDVVRRYGVQLRKNKANCPFHDENTDSFFVNVNRQIFKCFGCGVGGDSITFVSELFGLRNIDAAKKISEDFNLGIFAENISIEKRIQASKIQRKISKEKEEYKRLTDAYNDSVEKFAKLDRICIENEPVYPQEPSVIWLQCNEARHKEWSNLIEKELMLWNLNK